MRKKLCTIFTVLFLLSGIANAQLRIGITAGVTSNSLTGDAPLKTSYKGKIGYLAGLNAEYNVARDIRLAIQPRYYVTGTTVSYDVGEEEPVDSLRADINYVSFPLSMKVLSAGGAIFFSSGLDFKYLLKAELVNLKEPDTKKDIKYIFEKTDISVFFGFGGEIKFGKPVVSLELRYATSLMNLSNAESSPEAGLPERFRFNGFQLIAALSFPILK